MFLTCVGRRIRRGRWVRMILTTIVTLVRTTIVLSMMTWVLRRLWRRWRRITIVFPMMIVQLVISRPKQKGILALFYFILILVNFSSLRHIYNIIMSLILTLYAPVRLDDAVVGIIHYIARLLKYRIHFGLGRARRWCAMEGKLIGILTY